MLSYKLYLIFCSLNPVFYNAILRGLLDPEDGGTALLRNVVNCSPVDPEYFNLQVDQCLRARKGTGKSELRTGMHNNREDLQWND